MKTFKCPQICGLFLISMAFLLVSCPAYGQDQVGKTYTVYYAIASHEQYQALFGEGLPEPIEQVAFGWSRIEVDHAGKAQIATERGESSFFVPEGAAELLETVQTDGAQRLINLYGDAKWDQVLPQAEDIADQLLNLAQGARVENVSFDGVVLDFENVPARLKNEYLIAVWKIAKPLKEAGLEVWVAAQPREAYDLRILTRFVDSVILMLHDYEPKSLPPGSTIMATMRPQTPIQAIEAYLRDRVEPLSEQAKNKLRLQMSFASTQWKFKGTTVTGQDGERVYPYRPTYDLIEKRMGMINQGNWHYDEDAQNPYLVYYTKEDGAWNVLWYEDERSVRAKIELATAFGINRFSIWRLGNIPNAPTYQLGIPKLLEWEINQE